MLYRWCRQVLVSQSRVGVEISLAWLEGESYFNRELRSVDLQYSDGVVMDSVNKALSMFVPGLSQELPEKGRCITVAWCDTTHPDLFDLVALAEEPEQAFISRYILEG